MQKNIWQSFQLRGRHFIGKVGLCLILAIVALSLIVGFHSRSQAHAASAVTTQSNGSYTSLIYQVFGSYGDQAVRVAMCESSLNPSAYNGILGAAGLFQIIPGTWASTSEAANSPYDPVANIYAAYEIFSRDGFSWREWECQP